jgi:hypothetical protein
MAKGKKTGGRRKGSQNKTTATVKAALVEAFDKRGGVKALAEWAEAAPADFYKLWAKMLPQEISGPDGEPIKANFVLKWGDTEIPL